MPPRALDPVRYRVLIDRPAAHRFRVEAVFPEVPGGRDPVLRLPVWSPGSYLVREYARHLSALAARDGRGRRLGVEKVAKNAWRIRGGGSGPLRVSYDLYAFERSVRTSHVTADHAFLSGPAVFLYRDELRARPCAVEVEAPRGFRVACALTRKGRAFHAPDYDTLVDAPIECGRLRTIAFEVEGTPFRMVVCGDGDYDPARLRRDLKRIAAAERELFGTFPFAAYLAILNLTPASRGGLEHASSMALEWPALRFRPEEKYEDFLALFAHELFHAWNVKAAAPKAFRPYDYDRETPTRLLWWFEGATDYYDELLLCRAGLLTKRKYLDRAVDRWERVLDTPGRLHASLADASFDAWIKFYRPDENTPNSTVSYYEKGHLAALVLDLELRKATRGARSLDDVARLVLERGRKGLPEGGVRQAIVDVGGRAFGRWHERYIEGTEELPFAELLSAAGLVLEPKEKDGAKGAWLGAVLKTVGGRLSMATVLEGGPAASAGLSAGDEVVALDGRRVDETTLRERLEARVAGDRARLTAFRDERVLEVEVTLGAPRPRLRAVRDPGAGKAARERLASWLGEGTESLDSAAAPAAPAPPVSPRSARPPRSRRTRRRPRR